MVSVALPQDNNATLKKYGIIIGSLLVIGLFVWVYFSGKANGATNINLSNPLTNGEAPSASQAEVSQLAGKLHADLDGVNTFGHDNQAYQDLLAMSDTDFIRVYNEFNHRFQKDSGQTFHQWLNNEETWIQVGSKWPPLRDAAIQRMNKLKLL